MTTALIYDERYLQHQPGPEHPDQPQRLRAIVERLHSTHLWEQLVHIPVAPAEAAAVEALHDRSYIQRVRAACEAGEKFIDEEDSEVCPLSYEVALLAVGGTLAAVDAVMAGAYRGTTVRNAFCAVRPPGHHAERDRCMGFCLFNNVALAAQHLIRRHGLQRVAIVDFDVHHGNGTQHLFEQRADVLCISLHEHPSFQYPGTGFAWETGTGPGAGYTLNLPLQPHAGDREYRGAFLTAVLPALDAFKPQFLLLSSGFDACAHDPLGHMVVTAMGYAWMTRQLKMAAERWCGGKLVSVLEGGYDLRALAECTALHVGTLLQPEGHDELMAMKAGM
jgi:acetoin utilization deacetylase AcuC-like enzyme